MNGQASLLIKLLILNLIQKINHSRSKTGVIRILKGSFAKQTLQDTYFFKLGSFYGSLNRLSQEEIEKYIEQLFKEVYLTLNERQKISLTNKAIDFLDRVKKNKLMCSVSSFASPIPISYTQKKRFMDRLNLLIQVLSHLQTGERNFSPIIQDINTQYWIKEQLLPLQKDKIRQITEQLRKEIDDLSQYIDEIEQQLLLLRFTGNHRTAYTWSQLAEQLNRPKIELELCHDNLYYKLMLLACRNRERFNLLYTMTDLDKAFNAMSPSCKLTKDLLNQGFTIEQIVKKRKLKKGTVYDHLIDIIMIDRGKLNISRYVNQWKINDISRLYEKHKSKPLIFYKQNLKPEISYMDIKIVLASLAAEEGREIC